MNTITYYWLALICAIICGILFGISKKKNTFFARCFPERKHKTALKITISICFLATLIFGYLATIKDLPASFPNMLFGILGAISAFIPAYISYALYHQHTLIKITHDKNGKSINFEIWAINGLLLLSFIIPLVYLNIQGNIDAARLSDCCNCRNIGNSPN